MESNHPNMPSAELNPDAILMRTVWLLNAAVVSFVEAKLLIEEIVVTLPNTTLLLNTKAIPADQEDFFRSEVALFQKECQALLEKLALVRGDTNGD